MKKTEEQAVSIPRINLKKFQLKIVGDSPLITNNWSEKAKQQMLDKQMKKASSGKTAKDPWVNYCDSMYWLTEKPDNPTQEDVEKAKFGFPSIGFKASAATAGFRGGITKNKVSTNGVFHISGELVEIIAIPNIREDMVRIGMGTADIRYRGEFKDWAALLDITYNANVMSAEQIINLFNLAGFSVGVGEWRPERKGTSGMFHVE